MNKQFNDLEIEIEKKTSDVDKKYVADSEIEHSQEGQVLTPDNLDNVFTHCFERRKRWHCLR